MNSSRLSEDLAIVGRLKPGAKTAGATVTSDIVDMDIFDRALFIFNMGDYAAGNDGSVAVSVRASNDGASFTSDAALTGKALTTASYTGSALDDAVAVIEVTGAEMAAAGYRYCRLSVTPSNQNLTCSAIVLGGAARYKPASDYDLATVKEIIA